MEDPVSVVTFRAGASDPTSSGSAEILIAVRRKIAAVEQ
jgi:hypothetical protein